MLALLPLSFDGRSQSDSSRVFTEDFFLKVDNDAFLVQAVDRYYSSGIFFQYRKLSREGSLIDKLGGQKATKTIRSISFSHLFFTPSDLKLRTIDQLDRPYAGMMSIGYGISYYSKSSYLKAQFDAGILGPGAGVEQLQEWYHRLIGAKTPRGWRFQIGNSPVITLNMEYAKPLITTKKFQLLAEGSFQGGTVINQIKPGFGLRLGKFQSLDQSSYKSGRLGSVGVRSKKRAQLRESYFFLRPSIAFVLYDATIQGSIFSENSIHTEDPQRMRYHFQYGWAWALRRWDFGISFNNIRRETETSRDHYYVSIDLLMRI